MSVAILNRELRKLIPITRLKRFTAAEYNRLTEVGVFGPDDRMELLEGYLVKKMPHNEPHATVISLIQELIVALLYAPWKLRIQLPVLLSGDNVPEPDLAIVRGPLRRFLKHHPARADIALLIEVAHTTLDQDRGIKKEIYARDRIPEYWIVNLVESVVEVYSQPKGGRNPFYREMVSYGRGFSVPLRIEGKEVGIIAVNDLLP
jgi:Uma2 family endonuclease